ncbi:MAG: FecR domain-containing protein [Acidobacteriota bacterium]|nr:FecR domain-containing protein [Acidobacteriota bacterium]
MFSTHVTKNLSAYCHGELAAEESRQVAEHLIACKRCRGDLDEIKLGVKLAERLPQLSAPDSLWHELQARMTADLNEARVAKPKRSPFAFTVWRPTFAGVAAGLLLAVGLWAVWIYTREARPFWEVARLNGAPTIGLAPIGQTGRLAVGQWLETDNSSRAQIDVGSIGSVEIDPNTRVRLVETKATEHRLELERGRMSAHIWAPPRLFFVDTPSAVAADLGCAYTLEVDDAGAGLLHVTSGWVALQLKDRESMVPAGATCATRPGIGPGTPYFDDASQLFRQALATFDFEPESQDSSNTASLDLILKEARPRDTLTLWHLLERVEESARERIYDRMAVLTPPPDGVTREGVLQLDEQMLQQWKDKLVNTWTNESALRKTWIGLWTRALGKVRGLEGKK